MIAPEVIDELLVLGQAWEKRCLALLEILPPSTREYTQIINSLKKVQALLEEALLKEAK